MPLGRKEQDFGHFGRQVRCSLKVKNPHPAPQTQGASALAEMRLKLWAFTGATYCSLLGKRQRNSVQRAQVLEDRDPI